MLAAIVVVAGTLSVFSRNEPCYHGSREPLILGECKHR